MIPTAIEALPDTLLKADREFRLSVEAFRDQIACTSGNGTRRATAIAEANRAVLYYEQGDRARALLQLRQVTDTLKKLNLTVLLAEKSIITAARAADRALAMGANRREGALWTEGSIALEAAETALRSERYVQVQTNASIARRCFVRAVLAVRQENRKVADRIKTKKRARD